jgi:tRNA threonylcarbamoyladenosine biosynthesis protein TsaE
MEVLGARLTHVHEPGLAIFISGELGAGKSTLARGFLRALGNKGPVKSPTYTLVEPYELGTVNVYHFDLYRLSKPEELESIGARDYFGGDEICLVEWPERASGYLPRPDLEINITFSASGRRVTVKAITSAGERVAAGLCGNETS